MKNTYRIYWNLRKQLFSVKYEEKVISHEKRIILLTPLKSQPSYVSQAGRERVLRERQKNVHAYLQSNDIITTNLNEVIQDLGTYGDVLYPIKYNPYKFDSFMVEIENVYYPFKRNMVVLDNHFTLTHNATLCESVECSLLGGQYLPKITGYFTKNPNK